MRSVVAKIENALPVSSTVPVDPGCKTEFGTVGDVWRKAQEIVCAVEHDRLSQLTGGITGNSHRKRVVAEAGAIQGIALELLLDDASSAGGRGIVQYQFEGNTLDGSGFGNNALAVGIPGYTAGQLGQAIVFDGTNNLLRLPPNVANSAEFSFAAWVYWDGGGNWQRIFDFGDDTSHYLFLTPSSGNGTLRFAIRNGGSEQLIETTALPVGQWRHVAVTLSGGTGRLYTNGVLAAASGSFTIAPSQFGPALN